MTISSKSDHPATSVPTASGAPFRLGIAGLGSAGRAFVPGILANKGFELVAVADLSDDARTSFATEHRISAYTSVDALLAHPGLDAVYLATPTELHASHVAMACAAAIHVLVEKPMAASLEDARAMVESARSAGVVLLVGHSHSYDLPIKRMREIIAGGSLGQVRMVNTWCFSDWMHRPRRPDEFDLSLGGGVTFRQGSHQFDIIRLLCGGMARSVRAKTFDWDPARRSTGAHVVYMDFDDGAAATAVYNGYGKFSTMELGFGVSEWGFMQTPEERQASASKPANRSPEEERQAKRDRAARGIPADAPYQPFFGLTLVSCERGDIRQSPRGLFIYSVDGCSEEVLPTDRSPRDLVLAEFHDALSGVKPALHDGSWGLANLEICSAALASSQSGADVSLQEQVPVRE